MGVTWEEFWKMNPRIIKLLIKGHQEKIKEKDYLAWMFNQYTLSAVVTGVDIALRGKESKAKYIEEPKLQKAIEDMNLTQEELDQRALAEMLKFEEQWAFADRQKGLPVPELK